jgi:hypothetical protein
MTTLRYRPSIKEPPMLRSLNNTFCTAATASVALCFVILASAAADEPADGFKSLFNGKDFTGWIVPEGDNDHWRVVDGVIDYDAMSEAPGDKNLWTEREYGDFVLRVDWRIKETPYLNPNVPIIKPDGTTLAAADAVHEVARQLPGWRWMAWLYHVPGIKQLCRAIYAWIAARRHRLPVRRLHGGVLRPGIHRRCASRRDLAPSRRQMGGRGPDRRLGARAGDRWHTIPFATICPDCGI